MKIFLKSILQAETGKEKNNNSKWTLVRNRLFYIWSKLTESVMLVALQCFLKSNYWDIIGRAPGAWSQGAWMPPPSLCPTGWDQGSISSESGPEFITVFLPGWAQDLWWCLLLQRDKIKPFPPNSTLWLPYDQQTWRTSDCWPLYKRPFYTEYH